MTPKAALQIEMGEILRYYGLKEPPFSLSPNVRFFWLSAQHSVCVQKTLFMLENRQGLTTIIADIGMGKTTLLRYLFESLQEDKDNIVTILVNPQFPSPLQLLKAICGEFGLPSKRSKLEQMDELNNFLVEQYEAGKNVILLVDEAQLLVGQQFELIRQFLNFETGRAKLLQIVLTAQTELRNKLRLKRALLSRVAISSTLDAFTAADMDQMIDFRLIVAGRRDPLFTPDGKGAIYKLSGGIPRQAIKLCLASMILGNIEREPMINAGLVEAAAVDFEDGSHERDD
jgi:general secretion pathway protein A